MQDHPPFEIIDGDTSLGLVILADHATNLLPERYGRLGLPESAFERHIAYDIGVEGVVRGLSARLNAPAVMSRFSRLLIDPNRGEDDPTLVMRISDGAIIPGNHPITPEEWRSWGRQLSGVARSYCQDSNDWRHFLDGIKDYPLTAAMTAARQGLLDGLSATNSVTPSSTPNASHTDFTILSRSGRCVWNTPRISSFFFSGQLFGMGT